ncbi:hypothetical protein [Desulfoluna spongiiphila]|uniref:Uncharacterized protein n=1 Tax=Desulfoluna spongiiphila TaxID=419481 RepID=A0A1G5C2F5_9BACT|nr:hypothetical protein [Desulfoluna spongiiphila]SCX96649.1 hypothetical protein SAMN05216233_102336 [Desulfoluna spongiiphila]VVS94072.1 hypothetical protein DBB_36440 [Desulfoluna spongiiphila]
MKNGQAAEKNISKTVTIQLNIASGGPAGGQTFKKFDKQVLSEPFQALPK